MDLVDITRNEPRDLFDIWFLLLRNNLFDFDRNEVCKIFEEKFSFKPRVTTIKPRLLNPSLKLNWHKRLGKQIAKLPEIDEVIRDTIEKLEEIFN